MLGVSFSEIVMIAVVALIVVGPRRLPEILGTLGRWVARLRRMTTEVRRQTGIDEILREEGIAGGIAELRSVIRGDLSHFQRQVSGAPVVAPQTPPNAVVDAYGEAVAYDRLREEPIEGVDSYGAIPEDLLAAAAPIPAPEPVVVVAPQAVAPQAVANPPEAVAPQAVAPPEAPAPAKESA